jgi:hypothetical protein
MKYFERNYSNELIFLLVILISFILVLLLSLFWCLYRNSSDRKNVYVHERTPSTISTIDSIKLTIDNQYPKIIGEENNGEIVYILV